MAYAGQHSPRLRVAIERSAEGDALVVAASPLLRDNPEIDVGAGGRVIGRDMALELEVGLEQRLEIAGERRLRIEAAERSRDVARAAVEEVRWDVHQTVHALFNEVLLDRQQIESAERVVAFSESLLSVAQRQVEAGEISPLSLLVAEAEVARSRQELVTARQEELAARLELAAATGWPAETPPDPIGELPPVRRSPPLDWLLDTAMEHHPALRTAALEIVATDASVRLADREAWPEPTLGVAYGREGEGADSAQIWLVTLGIPIPLWQRNQGERAMARVDAQVARARAEALRTTLRPRVAQLASAVDAAAERVGIYGADVLPAFERNLERISRAYDLGELDIHQVSQTRARVIEMQMRALEALRDYYRTVENLEASIGTEPWLILEETP